MKGKHAEVLPPPRSGQVPPRPRSPVILLALMVAEGVAFAVLAGLDGSAVWRVARVLVAIAVTALAVWFTRRAGRTGQGATALVLGIAGTAAGAGAASGHLTKAGLDAAALAAAIVLVTGLVLLGWGAAALVRAIPGWWRLLAIPAALAILWFALVPLTVAVYATNLPPGPLGPATPAHYGLTYHDVAFRAAEGVQLSAWYIPPRNGAALVVLPGSGSTRTAVLGQAAVLARHGYGALLVDTRGHGLSGGHTMDFGWWRDRDITAAVSFLDWQPGVQAGKIAVLGESTLTLVPESWGGVASEKSALQLCGQCPDQLLWRGIAGRVANRTSAQRAAAVGRSGPCESLLKSASGERKTRSAGSLAVSAEPAWTSDS